MKRLMIVFFVFLTVVVLCGKYAGASEVFGGEPEKVTVTATTLVPGTWTLLNGSKFSVDTTMFWRRLYISERSQSYSFRYTFNPLTYTVVDDYTTIPAQTRESWRISMPTGVYASTTWTAGSGAVIELTTTK
jgi:hypothetical protein